MFLSALFGTTSADNSCAGLAHQQQARRVYIVGYNNNTVDKYMFVGPDFVKCDGGEGFKFSDLVVNCGEDEDTYETGWISCEDAIIELDADGSYKRTFVYLSAFLAVEGFDLDAEAAGWYDKKDVNAKTWKDEEGNWKKVDSTEIGFSNGIQINCKERQGGIITFSGAVKAGPTPVPVDKYQIVANCSPKTITIGELITNCGEDEDTYETGWISCEDGIIELDADGSYKRTFVYLSAFLAVEGFDLDAEAAGWYDKKDVNAKTWKDEEGNWKKVDSKISYAPGFGFQVNCKERQGGVITIKSALAKEAAE